MSTLGLWIVTGINTSLIAIVGVFTYFGLGGITRVVTKTGAELTTEVAEVSKEIPTKIAEAIKEQGDAMTANVAGAATNMANNQVSSLTDKVKDESAGIEMMPKMSPMPEATTPEATATLITQQGGRKQTKGNKPKKIRKPRTKKNIKKVGNQMHMNFSI